MPEQKPVPDRSSPAPRRSKREVLPGKHAQADGLQLRSYDVGALPLLKRIVERMQLQRILSEHLPRDDSRTELPTVTALLVLFANLLMAREPVYGVGEWAALFPPDLLGLREQDLSRLHDDRLGRCLDRMFEGIGPTLIMAVVRHVIQEFAVSLDELHNDSTTVSFYGAYDEAGQESEQRGRPTHAITWGHSKARRPDLKQLLYILTVTSDGNVPVYFSSASGNTVDDGTHIGTWDLLYELIGHADFLYVADCKLASSENLSHIATRGGRFVTVLPRGRSEDVAFRQRLRATPSVLKWTLLYALADEHGHDRRRVVRLRGRPCSFRGLSVALVSQYAEGRAGPITTCPVDPEGDRSAERLAGTPPRSAHPVPRAVQGGTGGGGDLGGGRGEFLAAG